MDHFNYQDGELFAEDVPLSRIAAEVGSPVYVYSTATLTRHFNVFKQALDWAPHHLICYAVKANSNIAVLKLLGDLGAGMDVVSIGEYARARTAGVPGDRIVFSGVGKSPESSPSSSMPVGEPSPNFLANSTILFMPRRLPIS